MLQIGPKKGTYGRGKVLLPSNVDICIPAHQKNALLRGRREKNDLFYNAHDSQMKTALMDGAGKCETGLGAETSGQAATVWDPCFVEGQKAKRAGEHEGNRDMFI